MILSNSTSSLQTLEAEAGTSSKANLVKDSGADGDHDAKIVNGKPDAAASVEDGNASEG